MEKLITWATIASFIIGGVLVGHFVISYIIRFPVVLKTSAWMFGVIFVFSLLRTAAKSLVESDWLDNSFKTKKK